MTPKNIEYQNGMFILSDPADVTELVRSLRGKPLNEYVSEPVPMTTGKSPSEMLEEINTHLQNIEEKLHQREGFLAQEFAVLTEKILAALQQTLEYQESQRQKFETERQQELVERDHRLLEKIEAMLDKKIAEGQQSSWWQKVFGS